MAKISIIVPVYQAEKQIEKCLDSIIKQTAKSEMEIILVNDGSTDRSEQVIQTYIQNHPEEKIQYFVKENEGVAKTRNYGIEKARGEYILFVDADDWIEKETIQKIQPYIEQGIDMIKFKLQRVDEDGKILEKVEGPTFNQVTGEKAFNQLYSTDILLDSPCVYAIKKELFTKNSFRFRKTYHEDFGLIPLLMIAAKSVIALPDYCYQYVQVQNSITRNEDYQKTLHKMNDVLDHYDHMLETIKSMKLEKRTNENIKIYYTNAIILKLKELKEKDKDKYIGEIRKRKMEQNIKARNVKQLIKKIILKIDIKLYLKMR